MVGPLLSLVVLLLSMISYVLCYTIDWIIVPRGSYMEVIEIKSAKGLLEVISLDNKKLNGFCIKSIFRGHADSNWLAIPSAFREEGDLLSDRELAPIGVRTNREQIEAEFHTLSLFIEELNLNGFHVPNEDVLRLDTNTTQFFNFLNQIGRGESVWPPKNYHTLISIAQHYGMPTRFLDFTYDPYVAIYFAAQGVLKGCDSEYMSIYAVDIHSANIRDYDFEMNYERDGLYEHRPENRIYQLVKSPSSFNNNLKSQRGLFLAAVEKSFYSNDYFDAYSLEDYLQADKNSKGVYKYIIESKHAEEIMELLHNRFYSASTLFPSIEGCVKGLYEKQGLVK
ncbi:FRG domain-containing protein [Vibrio parahaemolyticus]|nr:FRG domain-containing protein [Vibrio parahaemolyticus]EGR0986432.1 FRG domain-containing protein [Vibrio parahaemolyticus]EGR1373772.1 FRG domain-containing protein [Vibrio parahaemolyticus]EGR1950131.1 FRG domain-containing protein [Vibrio parahaemolyticus]TOG59717.1 FRG domain-containing protein [Vibrio parahaemolyticus]